MRDLDQRYSAQDRPWITALIAGIALTLDQAFGFIKVQGSDRDTAARGDFADGELFVQVFRGDHFAKGS